MRKKARKILLILPAISLLFLAGGAWAGTESLNMSVSANVVSGCQITGKTDVAFGFYDPTDKFDNDAGVGDFRFRCSKTIVYWTYVTGARQMIGTSGDILDFELYKEPARVTPVESIKTGPGAVSPGVAEQTVMLYGRIPAKQNIKIGGYSATLQVVVEY